MTDMPNFWWCPEHHLYRGGIERPCAEAVKLGDVERMRQELSAANAAEAEWHKLATAAVKGAEKANRERDALRAEIRAVLDEADRDHRIPGGLPLAELPAPGTYFDRIRAIVEREPSSPQPDSENRCASCEHRISMHGTEGCEQEIGHGPMDEPVCCPCQVTWGIRIEVQS